MTRRDTQGIPMPDLCPEFETSPQLSSARKHSGLSV